MAQTPVTTTTGRGRVRHRALPRHGSRVRALPRRDRRPHLPGKLLGAAAGPPRLRASPGLHLLPPAGRGAHDHAARLGQRLELDRQVESRSQCHRLLTWRDRHHGRGVPGGEPGDPALDRGAARLGRADRRRDPGDQGVVVLGRDEVGLAPDRQGVALECLPGLAQVLAGELAEEGSTPVDEGPAVGEELADPLSEREIEVLRLVATGATNRAIAETLFLAEGTVRNHLTNILGKSSLVEIDFPQVKLPLAA